MINSAGRDYSNRANRSNSVTLSVSVRRSGATSPNYSAAIASISIRNSGAPSAATPTNVWGGIFGPKDSPRIGP